MDVCAQRPSARYPPPYRAIPFRDSIAEGGIARVCLVFIGYSLGPAKTYILRGTARTYAIKTRVVTDN